jgi:uncharacterized membrane protein
MSGKTGPSDVTLRDTLAPLTFLAYPLWSHAAVTAGYPRFSAVGLAVAGLAFLLVSGSGIRSPRAWLPVAAGVILGLYDLVGARPVGLYLPPVVIHAALFATFARSLVPGRVPLLTLVARQVSGDVSARRARYTARLTKVWSVFLGLLLLESAVLPFVASVELWSLTTNVLNYVLVAGFFVAEFLFRSLYFRQWLNPLTFAARLMRTDFRQLR